MTTGAQATVQQFADAVVGEDYAAAEQYIREGPDRAMLANDLLPLFRANLEQQYGAMQTATAQEPQLADDETGTVTVVWEFADGQVESSWQVTRTDRGWRILNFAFDTPGDSGPQT